MLILLFYFTALSNNGFFQFNKPPPYNLSRGTYVFTYTATDLSGNVDFCRVNVIVGGIVLFLYFSIIYSVPEIPRTFSLDGLKLFCAIHSTKCCTNVRASLILLLQRFLCDSRRSCFGTDWAESYLFRLIVDLNFEKGKRSRKFKLNFCRVDAS